MPTFWLALLLMNLFGIKLGWLPISGIKSLDFEYLNLGQKIIDLSRHLILPIFVEDLKVWVDGVSKQPATVAAAQFPDNPTTNSTIIINGNLTRSDPTVTMVALIAQKNVLVPLKSPNVLEIQAVMIAQKGSVERYYYQNQGSDTIKNRIMVRGSIITNNIWTWSWVNSNNNVISGYQNTESYYEPALIYSPPPFFPSSGEQQFISWEEVPI